MSKELKKAFFAILFFIIIISFSYYEMKYYTIADDNNQLGVFNIQNDNIYNNIINTYRLYNVRPLAFFSDAYIFQWFWDNMYALLCIIVVMHICSIYFFYKICEKIDIKLNAVSIILFSVTPVLFEAIYWISASTRIVVSLFLTLLSIYLLLLSFDEEVKWKKLLKFISAIVINFMCVGYYEQTIALNLFLFSFVLICIKKYKYLFIPFLSTLWIGIYYVCSMMSGTMQERGNLNLNGLFGKAIELLKYVRKMFNDDRLNMKYILRERVAGDINNYIIIAILGIIIIYFIYYIYKNKCAKSDGKFSFKKLILGVILFIAPVLPFFILKDNLIATRNLYLPYLGICILLEVVYDFIFDIINKIIKHEKICYILKISILAIILCRCVLVNIDKLNDYKKVNELDNYIADQIINVLDEDAYKNEKTLSINYDVDTFYRLKDITNYVQCVAESGWAMMGKLQVKQKSVEVPLIYINSHENDADYVLYFDKNMQIIRSGAHRAP